jgi:hypothetical protein
MSQAPSLMAPVAETLREHASVKPRYGFSKSACHVPAIIGSEQAGSSTAGAGDWAEASHGKRPNSSDETAAPSSNRTMVFALPFGRSTSRSSMSVGSQPTHPA